MAISFVSNALGGTTTTTSFSITLPTTAAGDIIILEYTNRATAAATIAGTYSGPAFTSKHAQNYATNTFHGRTLWSRATGNHSGQTVTGSGLTDSCAAIVSIYRGCIPTGDPLAGATIVGEDNASANETQAQITTTVANAWVVLVVSNTPDLAVSSQTCTSPGALTVRAERLSTGGTDASITHASAEKATAGATGAFTWAMAPNAICGSWAYALVPDPPKDLVANAPGGSLSITGSNANLRGLTTINAWTFPGTSGARGYFSDLGTFRTEVGLAWTWATFFRVDTTAPAQDGGILAGRATSNDSPNHQILFEETNDKLSYTYNFGTEVDTGPVAPTTWYLAAITHSGAVSAPVVLRLISAAGVQLETINGVGVVSDFFDSTTQQITYGAITVTGSTTTREFLGRLCLPLFVRGTALSQAQLEAYALDPLNYGDGLLNSLGSQIAAWFDNSSLDRGPGGETLTLVSGAALGSGNGPSVPARNPGTMAATSGTLSITGTNATITGPISSNTTINAWTFPGADGDYAYFSDLGHFRTEVGVPWTWATFFRINAVGSEDVVIFAGRNATSDSYNHQLYFDNAASALIGDYNWSAGASTGGSTVAPTTWYLGALTHSGAVAAPVQLRLISQAGAQISSNTLVAGTVFADGQLPQQITYGAGYGGGVSYSEWPGRLCLPLFVRGTALTQAQLEAYAADPLNYGDTLLASLGSQITWFDDTNVDRGPNAETLTLAGGVTLGSLNGPLVPARPSINEDMVAAGSLSITGTASNLVALGKLAANAPGGTLSITGFANLVALGTLQAPGTVSITGTAANLRALGTLLATAAGSLSITGTQGGLTARGTLQAPGTLSITGSAALIGGGTSALTAQQGTLAITGSATLEGVAAASEDMVAAGSLAITGTMGDLRALGALAADGSLTIMGDAGGFEAGGGLGATGSLSITGQALLRSNVQIVGARLSTFGPFLHFQHGTGSQVLGLTYGILSADGTLEIVGNADASGSSALTATTGSLAITGAAGLSGLAVIRFGALPSRFGPFLSFRRGTGSDVVVASMALAATGALSITGTVANLEAGGAAPLSAGGFLQITGTGADLKLGGGLGATGTLAITGAANLEAGGAIQATAAGMLSITGSNAVLVAGLGARGTLAITGFAFLTEAGTSQLSATGSLSITGSSAFLVAGLGARGTLSITGAALLVGRGTLAATTTGSLAITGTNASLVSGSTSALTAQQGFLQITGTFADLEAQGALQATGSLSITGNAPLIAGSTSALTAQQGSLAITGTKAALATALRAVGTLAITGTSASLINAGSSALTAQQGTLAITGTAADLRALGALQAVGSVSITGTANLRARGTLAAATGSLEIDGTAVLINAGTSALTAQLGTLAIAGTGATPSARGSLVATATGVLAIDGSPQLTATGSLAASSGTLAIDGASHLMGAGTLATAAGEGEISITGSSAQLRGIGVLRSNGTLVVSGAAQLRAIGSLLASGTLVINGLTSLGTGGARYRAVVRARIRERSARAINRDRDAHAPVRIRDVRAKPGRNTT